MRRFQKAHKPLRTERAFDQAARVRRMKRCRQETPLRRVLRQWLKAFRLSAYRLRKEKVSTASKQGVSNRGYGCCAEPGAGAGCLAPGEGSLPRP